MYVEIIRDSIITNFTTLSEKINNYNKYLCTHDYFARKLVCLSFVYNSEITNLN